MKKSRLAVLAFCIGVVFLVPLGWLARAEGEHAEKVAAGILLGAAAKRDSIQKSRYERLKAKLDSATVRHKLNVADLNARIAALKPTLDSLEAEGTTSHRDTIYVPVSVIRDANATIRSCSLTVVTCEQRVAAEKEMRELAEENEATARGEADAAKKLIPTPRQKLVHDAKVVGFTIGAATLIKAALSLFQK